MCASAFLGAHVCGKHLTRNYHILEKLALSACSLPVGLPGCCGHFFSWKQGFFLSYFSFLSFKKSFSLHYNKITFVPPFSLSKPFHITLLSLLQICSLFSLLFYTCVHMHIYIHTHIYIAKHNLLNSYNVTSVYVFRADQLAMNKFLSEKISVCLSICLSCFLETEYFM